MQLLFSYTVVAADADADGVALKANSLVLNGGTIRATDDSTDAELAHEAMHFPDHDVNPELVPRVTGTAITSDPGTDGAYTTLDVITVSLTFGEAVTVTGAPTVTLDIGGTERTADYAGEGEETGQLLFSYVVVAADADDDGVALVANSLTLNVGTIRATDDTRDAALVHGVMTFPDHKVNPVLVSNAGQTAGDDLTTAAGRAVYAQSFTTGDNPDGYFLSSVELGLGAASGIAAKVEIITSRTVPAIGGYHYAPDTSMEEFGVLVTLHPVDVIDDDASTLERFATNDVLLLPNRTYWIVVTRTGGAENGLSVATTMAEGAVDSGGLTGFSLGNSVWTRDPAAVSNINAEGWADYSGSDDTGMKIRLRGSGATRPLGPYVTNRNQQTRSAPAETGASRTRYATSFRTGVPQLLPGVPVVSGITSFDLTSVSLGVAAETGVSPRVAIHADSGGSPAGDPVANGTLTAPVQISRDLGAPERAEFTASAPITLATNRTYWVVIDRASGSGKLSVSTTRSDEEDHPGLDRRRGGNIWAIGDSMKTYGGSSWSDVQGRTFRMALHGTTDVWASIVAFGLPQVGVGLVPEIIDNSARISNESWQWQRAEARDGTFTDIPAADGGTLRMYVPSPADLGKWLRAQVTYDDAFGTGKSASGTSTQPVLSEPIVSNAGESGVSNIILEAEAGALQIAQAFTTGAVGRLLSGLRLPLAVDPWHANALSWALHADEDGEPAATPLSEEVRVPSDILDDDLQTFEELLHPGFELAPNTTYWAVLTSAPLPEVTVRFEEESYTVDEDGSLDLVVTLSADPDRTIEIPITTVNLGSTSASDYSHTPESVTFEAGQTEQTVTFTPFDDDENDDDESVMLVFGFMPDRRVNPWPAGAAIVNIIDNEQPEVTASFASDTYTVAEGGTAVVTVTLSEDPERAVTIPITIDNQGDTSNSDYSGVPASVTFNSRRNVPVVHLHGGERQRGRERAHRVRHAAGRGERVDAGGGDGGDAGHDDGDHRRRAAVGLIRLERPIRRRGGRRGGRHRAVERGRAGHGHRAGLVPSTWVEPATRTTPACQPASPSAAATLPGPSPSRPQRTTWTNRGRG